MAGSQCLKIMAFSDWRAQPFEPLYELVKIHRPDLILYGGDDTSRFERDGINVFEQLAERVPFGLAGIIGNDCTRAEKRLLRGRNVVDLHDTVLQVGPLAIVGQEGATTSTINKLGFTLYDETEIADHLQVLLDRVPSASTVALVSHCPPKGVLDLGVRFGKDNLGSTAVRELVEQDPRLRLLLCGHVHLFGGRSEKLGGSTVVNAASHDHRGAMGRVAEIDIL